jgi:peptide/nickel transport system ATP-binding protein
MADRVISARSADPVLAGTEELAASVRDLTVTFRRGGAEVHAVRGVNLDIRAGEVMALVGESGSGKSVLGMSLLGLPPLSGPPPHSTGSVTVCGVDMVTASERERRRVRANELGAVFQDPMTSLNPTMRIGRQLIETCGSRAEALRLLDAVGVPRAAERMDAFPHELSGGLRQRAMIAMALGGHPRLVVADEPTTALDVSVQAQILELIREICDELGTAVLFITHDLGVAGDIADRVCVLYAGRVAELAKASDVLAAPQHPYSLALLQSRIGLDTDCSAPLHSLPGGPPDPRRPRAGCAFAPRCEFAEPACDSSLPAPESVDGDPGRSTACIRHEQIRGTLLALRPPPAPLAAAVEPPAPGPAGDRVAAVPEDGDRTGVAVRDVHLSYASHGSGAVRRTRLHALRGVSLRVDLGESVAVVGESGCGKSTLLRVIAGLADPDSGSVTLGGRELPQLVFQDAGASLTPWLSVGEILADRLRATVKSAAERRARVAAILESVGLPADLAGVLPAQLSGGQRQRIALARAMIIPPPVLLCDEPTSALDVSLAASVLNLLGRLRAETGTSMIFVTHDLAAARYVADRILVMYLGEIVEEGPAEQVARAPRHPYTEALLSAVPGRGSRIRLTGEPASPTEVPDGCSFHSRCPIAEPGCTTHRLELVTVGATDGSLRCRVRARDEETIREEC